MVIFLDVVHSLDRLSFASHAPPNNFVDFSIYRIFPNISPERPQFILFYELPLMPLAKGFLKTPIFRNYSIEFHLSWGHSTTVDLPGN